VIDRAAQEWQDFCDALRQYSARLDRNNAMHVNSLNLRNETKRIAQMYFGNIRPYLKQFQLDEFIEPLSAAFKALVELSEGRNPTSSYKRRVNPIRKVLPRVTSQLVIHGASAAPAVSSSETDQKILQTLTDLVPSAALSYEQALLDLADPKRLSFRGPAHELRESLRELLDHLAPDPEVVNAPGFKLEKDRPKPTMKQKVRFILKARDQNPTDSAAPEHAANAIDALIADMTRSTYDQGSLSAQKERGREGVQRLKRYVDVIFHDLLEL